MRNVPRRWTAPGGRKSPKESWAAGARTAESSKVAIAIEPVLALTSRTRTSQDWHGDTIGPELIAYSSGVLSGPCALRRTLVLPSERTFTLDGAENQLWWMSAP